MNQNYFIMKHLKTFLFTLAVFGLSVSAMAQSTYVITDNGTNFDASKSGDSFVSDLPIQGIIDAIKADADGADCTIQFENGSFTLYVPGPQTNIHFDGGTSGTDWGVITLKGKLISECYIFYGGAIKLTNGVHINSYADITALLSGYDGGSFPFNNVSGTLTICDGTLKGDGWCILNTGTLNITGGKFEIALTQPAINVAPVLNGSKGILNISGGTVDGGINSAIISHNSAKATISGDAVIKSSVMYQYDDFFKWGSGTISIVINDESSDECLKITGGTIENTGEEGVVLCNISPAEASIEGGILKASGTDGKAIYNRDGTVIFSKGVVLANGTTITDVIYGDITQVDDAVIVAWDKAAGNTNYDIGTSNDLFKLPEEEANVVWNRQGEDNGISVKMGATDAFIPMEGITVEDVGVKTLTNNELRLYPNPTTSLLTLDNGDLKIKNVEVFDIMGRKQLSIVNCPLSIKKMDISDLSNGIYFLKITTENGVVMKKIIKN